MLGRIEDIVWPCTLTFLYVFDIAGERERIAFLGRCRIQSGKLAVNGFQTVGRTSIGSEFDLSGGVCGEHFVELKIAFIVVEFRDGRGQEDGLPVADAALLRHGGKRRHFDLAARQALDVDAKYVLHGFERNARLRLLELVA